MKVIVASLGKRTNVALIMKCAPYKLRRSKVKRIPLKTSERYQTKDVGTENKLAIPQVSSHTINGFLQL